MKALALLNDSIDVRLTIAGSGTRYNLSHLKYLAFKLGISSKIRWLGHVSPQELANHVNHSDILIQPSVSEGFCNAVIEAQACGIPVICSDTDGLPENKIGRAHV